MAERKGRGRKISIVHIAQILLSESDAEHPLSQQQILAFLRERYGTNWTRNSNAEGFPLCVMPTTQIGRAHV